MAAGDVTFSGAFTVADITNIDTFVTAATSAGGGNSVFVLPDVNSSKFWIGCVEGII